MAGRERSGGSGARGGGYTAEQRRSLKEAVARGETPACPACGGELSRSDVRPGESVSYVRRRVWLLCGGCRRGGAVDLPRESRGS